MAWAMYSFFQALDPGGKGIVAWTRRVCHIMAQHLGAWHKRVACCILLGSRQYDGSTKYFLFGAWPSGKEANATGHVRPHT